MRILLSIFALAALSFTSAQSIDLDQSTVEWTGKKITGQHTGNINIQEADFQYEDGKLVGGTLVMDMTSITCTDLEGEKAEKLVGHLKSTDFFEVDAYPESVLTFDRVKQIEGYSYFIVGELSIKGQTHPIEFYANLKETGAEATIKVDRTKYDVRYGSKSFFDNLGEKAIDDIFEVKARLEYQ